MAAPEDVLKLAEENQRRAWSVVRESGVVEAWESIGAQVNMIGSLKLGLLMTHRDIDFHIYTDELDVSESFRVIATIAANPAVKRVEYANLADTKEKCIEWHAWYEDSCGDEWQLDMIHILRGSFFDGYFENVGDRIAALLTEERKSTILKLKYETPEYDKLPGVIYYRAVIEGGVETREELAEWLEEHPADSIDLWTP